jgi:hypothetical protein
MFLKILGGILILLMMSFAMQGQISGNVFEYSNGVEQSLIGVNVYWQDKSGGTVTDAKGYFKLNLSQSSNMLIFSYIGYENDTLIVNDSNLINPLKIVLSSTNVLTEVLIGERKAGTHISRLDPLNRQTINNEELQQAACCNLGESFETNASVDASYSDAATGSKQIKMLGLSGKYVQMLTENIPNFYGLATAYGLGYIPGSWMKSIAVSKGTSTVSYGFEGITGQINTWYKEPEKFSDYFYLNLLGSTSGKTEVNTDVTVNLSDKVATTLMFHAENNWLEHDENSDGFSDIPAIRQYNLLNRYTIHWNNNLTSKFGIQYLDESRRGGQLDFDHTLPLEEQTAYGIGIETQRALFFWKSGLTFKTPLESSLAFISSVSYHHQNSFYGQTIYDAEQYSGYLNLIYKADFFNEKHNIGVGISFKTDHYLERLNSIDLNRIENVPGAFLEYTVKPTNKIVIIAGFRADYNSIYGLFTTPRLHIKANLTGSTTLRASVGKAYRTGSVLAENSYLLASSREIIIANDLDAEQALNAGANITQYIYLGNKEISLQVEYYRTEFINQLVVDLDSDVDQIRFYNLTGQSFSNVWQVEMQYPFVRGMQFTAAFRYNDVRQTIAESLMEMPLTNRYKGLLSLSYKTPLNKWQFDATAQFNGPGRVPSTSDNIEIYQRPNHFDSYAIYNAQVTKYFKNWNIYFGVENLLNFKQENPIIAADMPWGDNFDASLIWGPVHGRKWYLGLRYNIARKPKQD